MSITVTLPYDTVQDPAIAQALARLFLALGGSDDATDEAARAAARHSPIAAALSVWVDTAPPSVATRAAAAGRAAAGGVPSATAGVPSAAAGLPARSAIEPDQASTASANTASANTASANTASATDAADWTPATSATDGASPAVISAPGPSSAPARRPEAPAAAPAAVPARVVGPASIPVALAAADPTEPMDLEGFVRTLPPASLRFIQIVQRRRVVRLSEIVEWLALPTAKALGGITGAIARWAPMRGVKVPFEAFKIHGERAWRWLAKDAPDFGDPILPISKVAQRQRREEAASAASPAAARETREPVAVAAPVVRQPIPEAPPRPAPAVVRPASAPPRAAFSGGGNVYGARVPPASVPTIPTSRGSVAPRGVPPVAAPAPSAAARTSAPSAPARTSAPPVRVAAAPPEPQPPPAPRAPRDVEKAVSSLRERLSEQQFRVIEIIRGRVTVTMRELRDELKLHKAQHLTELMRSIDDRAAAIGVDLPWNTEFDASGEKTYYWGYDLPPASERPTVGGAEHPHPAASAMSSNHSHSRGVVGVRVRRSRPVN